MKPGALDRLQPLLRAARMAEAARLAAVLGEISRLNRLSGECRARATAPGPDTRAAPGRAGFDLVARARWSERMLDRAREADRKAAELAAEAEALRPRVAGALGRERVTAKLAARLRALRLHEIERRADDAGPAAGAGFQPDEPDSEASGSAGSPGMA